jgi:hypothetical protein
MAGNSASGEPGLVGHVEEERFWVAIGRAVTAWADLERELFETAAVSLTASREHAVIVFYRARTIRSRLVLTGALVDSSLAHDPADEHPDPLITEWENLHAAMIGSLSIRNKLARHPVAPLIDVYISGSEEENRFELRTETQVREGDRAGAFEPVSPLGIDEIVAHAESVSSLVARVRNFRERAFSRGFMSQREM